MSLLTFVVGERFVRLFVCLYQFRFHLGLANSVGNILIPLPPSPSQMAIRVYQTWNKYWDVRLKIINYPKSISILDQKRALFILSIFRGRAFLLCVNFLDGSANSHQFQCIFSSNSARNWTQRIIIGDDRTIVNLRTLGDVGEQQRGGAVWIARRWFLRLCMQGEPPCHVQHFDTLLTKCIISYNTSTLHYNVWCTWCIY